MANRNEQARKAFSRWKADYDYKTFVNSAASTFITAAFALYNGYLGLRHLSPWHWSICAYYALLALLRAVTVHAERSAVERRQPALRRKTHRMAAVLLLGLNLCLIGPIWLMIRQAKPVALTLIPAIAMATYTTYKITIAAVNLKKKNHSGNRLVRLLRTINFVDALQSIAVLQNTLIMVSSKGNNRDMIPFTAVTSAVIWAAIVAISVSALIQGGKA